MLNFINHLLTEARMDSPDHMKRTFDDYMKYSGGSIHYDKRDKDKLIFHASKSVCNDIRHIIGNKSNGMLGKVFTMSAVSKDNNQYTFVISFI
jgi:hypothetical protein